MAHPRLLTSKRHQVTTGLMSGVAAGTSTAGHILALRVNGSGKVVCLKSLEIELDVTTAFSSAQRVGFDVFIARAYTAAHTNATALTFTGNSGKAITDSIDTVLTGRIADTGALTAGTHTLDTNPIARGEIYTSAIGSQLGPRFYDFTAMPQGGIILAHEEGIVVRNSVLMGASGVVVAHFTFEVEDRNA